MQQFIKFYTAPTDIDKISVNLEGLSLVAESTQTNIFRVSEFLYYNMQGLKSHILSDIEVNKLKFFAKVDLSFWNSSFTNSSELLEVFDKAIKGEILLILDAEIYM